MPDQRVTIVQDEDDRLAHDHGAVALHGSKDAPAISHHVQPLVHMVCWDEEPIQAEVSVDGRVALSGDPESPVLVRMQHEFASDHHQTVAVEPVDHTLHVDSALAAPIHHALQMRTPLELRFCNPWHVTSDYHVEVNLGNNRVIGIRLTGATVATPQPCADDVDCPPAPSVRTYP